MNFFHSVTVPARVKPISSAGWATTGPGSRDRCAVRDAGERFATFRPIVTRPLTNLIQTDKRTPKRNAILASPSCHEFSQLRISRSSGDLSPPQKVEPGESSPLPHDVSEDERYHKMVQGMLCPIFIHDPASKFRRWEGYTQGHDLQGPMQSYCLSALTLQSYMNGTSVASFACYGIILLKGTLQCRRANSPYSFLGCNTEITPHERRVIFKRHPQEGAD
ncbi:uncharacterized protein CIMG_13703 [Coccidioides immitis RS]|uniref:Uncharacterized protein n=1 Tax=Coccidioides immitis (strain RS) TaxID=246410 RepID=A0A0D8JVY6_COCIM|nr:uncharacterized protein CIMG_13703 [Coccidioides immitis RS]KJF61490.1 hypothetical protein CIMG_13703 [Coccidioides immitis RS]